MLCEPRAERAAIRHGVTFPRLVEASRGRLTPSQPAGTGSHEARAKNTRPLRKSQRGGFVLAPAGQLPKPVARSTARGRGETPRGCPDSFAFPPWPIVLIC